MKIRKIKKRNQLKQRSNKKAYIMIQKFIEVSNNLYPLNDRIIFKREILPNGTHALFINYTDSKNENIQVGDITNYKSLPFEKQIENILSGRIKIINL